MGSRVPRTAARRGRPPSLSRDRVLAAGVDVGLHELTLVAVAERLEVPGPTLYSYVDGLDDLARGVAGVLVEQVDLPTPQGREPIGFAAEAGLRLRGVTSAHPGLAEFYLRRAWPELLAYEERLAAGLVACGLAAPAAVFVTDDVVAFTMLATAAEQVEGQDGDDVERRFGVPQPTYVAARHAVTPHAPDEVFDWRLRAHLDGVFRALAGSRPPWRDRT